MGARIVEDAFPGGVEYLRFGQGPALLMLGRGTGAHANPTGIARRMALSGLDRIAEHFTVHLAAAPPGLEPGSTMSDLAARYAHGVEGGFEGPVMVHGVSSGGSIALQLAIDHPHLVRRMVLAGTACRLSPQGRRWTAEAARAIEGADYRTALARMSSTMVTRPWRCLVGAAGWLAGPWMFEDDPSDTLVSLAAEIDLDLEPDLARINAPTLVIGGGEDPWYTPDLVRRTAEGIPNARAVILPGRSHSHVIGSRTALTIALGFLLADQRSSTAGAVFP